MPTLSSFAIVALTVVMQFASSTLSSTTRFLVTGCSRGIGLGLCSELLSASPSNVVVATCRSPSTSDGLQSLVQRYGPERLVVLPLDTTSLAGHREVVAALSARGMHDIDVFIANAGVSNPAHPVDPVLSCSEEDMMTVFRTNCVGTLFGLQTFTPLLLNKPAGAKVVVLLSSRLASIEQAAGLGGYTSYRASKAAMNMLAMTYSEDPAVRDAQVLTLCVHPGWVQTDMGGSGGRKAPVSVEASARGIAQQAARAIAYRRKLATGAPPAASVSDDPLEQAFAKNRCVFTAFDGEMLPW